jgi:hypothetical protein
LITLRTPIFLPENGPQERQLNVSNCLTALEAVEVFEKKFSAKILPFTGFDDDNGCLIHDPSDPKYFTCKYEKDKRKMLIDIHINRLDEYNWPNIICLKQDLSFRLMDGDEVSMGELAC